MSLSPWKRFVLGLFCLAVPIAGITWWIVVAETSDMSHTDTVERFLSPFPGFLRDAGLVTWIQVGFAAVAVAVFVTGVKSRTIPKWLSLPLLGFSGLILLWLLFSLM